jgi:cell division protein FtsZ
MKSILMNAEQHIRRDKPFEIDLNMEENLGRARIVVIGCGGAGNNTINRLEKIGGINGAETIAINTDRQHLEATQADKHLLIGRGVTKGLGAGGDPVLGYQSAEEDRKEIKKVLEGANMVFVAAGMGGGTGTGAAPVVADIASELDALVIGVVTLPFSMEGKHRHEKAQMGLKAIQRAADTVITLDNNKLMELCPHAPLDYAFSVSDEVLAEMVKGISETILEPSLVNLDYADVRAVMTDGGVAMVGVGESNTNNRAQESVEEALRNRLLEVDYTNAKGALVHVSGGPDMKLSEASAVGEYINKLIGDESSKILWGARVDESLKDSMRVMLIITGVSSPYIAGKRPADGRTTMSLSEIFTPRGTGIDQSHSIYEYLGIDEVDYGR